MPRPSRDETHYWRIGALNNLHMLRADFRALEFSRHFHDTFVIQVVETGADRFECDGRIHIAPPLSIVAINPGSVHTGMPFRGALAYRSYYPGDCGRRFTEPVLNSPALAEQILRAHCKLELEPGDAGAQAELVHLTEELFSRFAHEAPSPKRDVNIPLEKARRYLHKRLDRTISISELARYAGYSPSHFIRTFTKEFGLPPHVYALNARVEKARKLIDSEMPLGIVAATTGFADQSHFVRHFKRIVGVTPGAYAQAC